MEDHLTQVIKKNIQDEISHEIDKEIEQEVLKFERKLLDRKDKYIAEVMKGIRIYHEISPQTNIMQYTIVFENIVRREDNI